MALTVHAKERMRRNTVPITYRASCTQCQAIAINGMLCHEQGCPIAWKDYTRECRWCGSIFDPETQWQDCCSNACAESYHS